jgi:hypothetical protein
MRCSTASVGAVELRSSLNLAFDLDMPATVIFDYPSIAALAGFVEVQMQASTDVASRSTKGSVLHFTESGTGMQQTNIAEADWSSVPGIPTAIPIPMRPAMMHTALLGACGRYPCTTNSGDLASFWAIMNDCVDIPSGMPLQRWDVERHYGTQDGGKQGTMYVRLGGFVDDIDAFDIALFRWGQTS